jgi:hypothetical protein
VVGISNLLLPNRVSEVLVTFAAPKRFNIVLVPNGPSPSRISSAQRIVDQERLVVLEVRVKMQVQANGSFNSSCSVVRTRN